MARKKREPKPPRKKIRTKLRERLTVFWEDHREVWHVLDLITWGLSGLFVLAFLFWFHDHPYPWVIGLGLVVLLLKLLCIVINPKFVARREEKKRLEEEAKLRKP